MNRFVCIGEVYLHISGISSLDQLPDGKDKRGAELQGSKMVFFKLNS